MYKDFVFRNFTKLFSYDNIANERTVYFLKNMCFMTDGSLQGRKALVKKLSFPNCHSPFNIDNNLFLFCSCSTNDRLYLYDKNTNNVLFLTEMPTYFETLFYVFYDNKVFMSNEFWNGVLLLGNNQLISWKAETVSLDYINEGSDYFFYDVEEMPKVKCLGLLAGRILGIRGNKLFFTESLFPLIYRSYQFIEFDVTLRDLLILDKDNVVIILGEGVWYLGKLEDPKNFLFSFRKFEGNISLGVSMDGSLKNTFFLKDGKIVDLDGNVRSGIGLSSILGKFDNLVKGKECSKRFVGGPQLSFGDQVIVEVIKKK